MSIKEMKKFLRLKHIYIGYPERPAWLRMATKERREAYRKSMNERIKELFLKHGGAL